MSHKLPSSNSCFLLLGKPSVQHTNLHGGTILQARDTKASCSSSHSCWLCQLPMLSSCFSSTFPPHSISEPPSSGALLVWGWKAAPQHWFYSHNHRPSAVQPTAETHLKTVLFLSWSFLLTADHVKSWKHQFTRGDKWWAAFVWSLGTAGKGWDNSGGFQLVVSVCSSQQVHFTRAIRVTGTFASPLHVLQHLGTGGVWDQAKTSQMP